MANCSMTGVPARTTFYHLIQPKKIVRPSWSRGRLPRNLKLDPPFRIQYTTRSGEMKHPTRRSARSLVAAIMLSVVAPPARADQTSPDGLWTTVDQFPAVHEQGPAWIRPAQFQRALLDYNAIANFMQTAPM